MTGDGNFWLTFHDNTSYKGNLFNKDWSRLPNDVVIKEVIFSFGGRSVKMVNMREYNLTYETHVVMGKGEIIRNITLVGRCDKNSILHVFDFKTQEIVRVEVPLYTEYGNWISSTWKKGVQEGKPEDYHA